jgi:hypothetical protein
MRPDLHKIFQKIEKELISGSCHEVRINGYPNNTYAFKENIATCQFLS